MQFPKATIKIFFLLLIFSDFHFCFKYRTDIDIQGVRFRLPKTTFQKAFFEYHRTYRQFPGTAILSPLTYFKDDIFRPHWPSIKAVNLPLSVKIFTTLGLIRGRTIPGCEQQLARVDEKFATSSYRR